jgi:dipeptidase D
LGYLHGSSWNKGKGGIMESAIHGLEPQPLWEHFYRMSRIPRCSGNEEGVRNYILDIAERNRLHHKGDSAGNVVIKKPATPGYEEKRTIVLQGHLDMVCEKHRSTQHDFSRDPITLKRQGDWITADGTTLGSDNGIGVAAALAVLEDKNLEHGPIEALFTVSEETGLTGAREMAPDMLQGRILLNMDSEEDSAIFIGCAGGMNTELFLELETEAPPPGYGAVQVRVGGLRGGHSGLNIHEGCGNAIKLLARFLRKQAPPLDLRQASINGGSKRNAIPRDCEALAYVPSQNLTRLKDAATACDRDYRNEYSLTDPAVFLSIQEGGFSPPERVLTMSLQNRLLNLLFSMPHGVISMSQVVPGFVETSTNLAVVHTGDAQISLLTSQRSSTQTWLTEIADMVYGVGRRAGAEVHQEGGYPPWTPNPGSPTLNAAKSIYRDLFGHEPEVRAIHAGLECAIIGEKFPGIDMISFGPTISGAHCPDERVQISSVRKFWDFLVAMLEGAAR